MLYQLKAPARRARSTVNRILRHGLTRPRKVFGIGLNSTGTTSLGHCMAALGYRHCGYDGALLRQAASGDMKPLMDAARRFDSFEDLPWPLHYRELFDIYGDTAQYILTVRSDPLVWVKSLKNHSLRGSPDSPARLLTFGHHYPHGYEAEHMAFYERHNAEVREFFAGRSDIFLEICWENGDGWPELCRFLGQRVPTRPLPHSNASRNAPVNPDYARINAARIDEQLSRVRSKTPS